jgi:very-short-patch-repair endonuclease
MVQPRARDAWALAGRQHGVISTEQLRELDFSWKAIEHRVASGRLHRLYQGVYAVGRRDVTQFGHLMAAVLASGEGAVLSHESAAALWGIRPWRGGRIEVSVPAQRRVRRKGIKPHRRAKLRAQDTTTRHGIPVTTPLLTLIDLATRLGTERLEAAVNEADKLDLIDPETLRAGLAGRREPGAGRLRRVLDERTFTLTDSELERRFRPIARRAGLPKPGARKRVNGHRVDFYWAELGLVVETDGLRYHRTPAQQTADRIRDQDHTAAGLTQLRFTHAQIRFEPQRVEATLQAVARRLASIR